MNKVFFKACVAFCAGLFLLACTPETKPDSNEPDGGKPVEKPDDNGPVVLTKCPFSKGVNLSDWLDMEADFYCVDKYKPEDFDDLYTLGVDVVRVPIRFTIFTGAGPKYTLSDKFFTELDKAIKYAEDHEMYIILDNHTYLADRVFPPTYGEKLLTECWRQIAEHCKDKSKYVIYELYNEPHVGESADYIRLQNNMLAAIREIDTKHTVIVTGLGCAIDELDKLPEYEDKNLIYTFHFYAPFIFTHQGAAFNHALANFNNLPFPYDATKMPAMPQHFVGTEWETQYNAYKEEGKEDHIYNEIDKVISFASKRNVPVFCGEFGTVNTVENTARCAYMRIVRSYMDANDIGWTIWDYRKDFSLFTHSSPIFDVNLNVDLVDALGFNIPPSYLDGRVPVIDVYDEGVPSWWRILYWSGQVDVADFAYKGDSFSGDMCIKWDITTNYSSASMEMLNLNVDFSKQQEAGYNMTFHIKASEDLAKTVVRFVMWDNERLPKAWRMMAEIGQGTPYPVLKNNGWTEISIPLSDFWINGCEDTENWPANPNPPYSTFDWEKVNKIQFAAENNQALKGTTVYLDNIKIKPVEE